MPPTNGNGTSSFSSDDVTEAAPSPSPATGNENDNSTGERACDGSNSNSHIDSNSKDCSHTSEKDVVDEDDDIQVDIKEDDIDTKKKYPNPQLQQTNASTNTSHITLSNNAIAITIETKNSNKTSRAAICGKPKRRTLQKMAVSTKIAGTEKQKQIQKQPQTLTKQKTTRRIRTVVLLHSPSHTALMHSTMKHIHQDRDILLSSLLYCCGFIKDAPRFFRVIKPRVATRSHLECFHQRDYLDLIENNNQHYDCGFHGRGRGFGRGYCLSRGRMGDNKCATGSESESGRVRSAVCDDLEMELGLEEHEHEQHYYDVVDDDDDDDGGDRDSVGKSLAQTPVNVKANANDAYHKLLDAYGLTDDCFLPSDPIQRKQLWRYCLAIAGASIHAAQLLVSRHPIVGAGVGLGLGIDADTYADADADVAINWSGGRHHAHADKASGFCYVNDVVLAIHTLINNMDLNQRQQRQRQRQWQREQQHSGEKQRQQDERQSNNHRNSILRQRRQRRVMYLDVDIHHADGVQSAFYSTDQVLTISLHRHAPGFFPSQSGSNREKGKHGTPGVGYNLNIPLPRSLCDDDYVMMVQEVLDEVGMVYDPDVVVLCVGADGLRGDDLVKDTMEGWNLTPEGLAESVRRVACFCAGVPHGVAHANANADAHADANADESGDDYDYDSQGDGRDDTQSNRRRLRNRKLLIFGGGGYNPVNTARALLLCTAAACEGARPGMLWRELPTDVPRHEHFDRYGPSFELVQRQRRTHAGDNANVTFDARTGSLDSNLSINDKRSTITGKGMLERTDGYSRTIEQAKRDINLTHLFLSNQQFVQEGEVIGDFNCCGDFKDSDCTLYASKGSSTSCNIIAGTISAIDRKPTVIENHAAAVKPKTRKLSRRRRRQK